MTEKQDNDSDEYGVMRDRIRQFERLHQERVKEKVKDSWFKRWFGRCLDCSVREFHRFFGLCSQSYLDYIKDSKGFLTKEDGYLDYSEWHVASMSTGLAVASFVVHPVFLGVYLLVTRKVVKDEIQEHSSLREIDGELPYWFGFYIVVSLVLMELGYSLDLTGFMSLVTTFIGL